MISIIVPVYNKQSELQICIESILNQKYSDIEVILVDDGSTDESGMICDSYAESDGRVTVIHQANAGAGAARNAGIEAAAGQYVFFSDADDYLEETSLEDLLAVKRVFIYPLQLIIGNAKVFRNGLQIDTVYAESDELLTKEDVVNRTRLFLKNPSRYSSFTSVWGKLFDLEIIKKFGVKFSNLKTMQDMEFVYHYLEHVDYVGMTKKIVYNYRVLTPNSLSGLQFKMLSKCDFLFFQSYEKGPLVSLDTFLANYYTRRGELSLHKKELEKEYHSSEVYFVIMQLVRYCRQVSWRNFFTAYSVIHKALKVQELKRKSYDYIVVDGNSKVIPFCMRYGMTGCLILVCRARAYKAFGKPISNKRG